MTPDQDGVETLAELYLNATHTRGAAELFVDDNERLSGNAVRELSLATAAWLDTVSQPGDVVAFLCRASARHAATWFGVCIADRQACTIHSRDTAPKIAEILKWLAVKVLVIDDELAPLAHEVLAHTGTSLKVLSLETGAGADLRIADLAAPVAPPALPIPDSPAAIILSSGTTGTPKGVVHTQRTLLATSRGGVYTFGPIHVHTRALLFMQPSFAAWAIIVIPVIGNGGAVVFGRHFTPERFLAACAAERITLAPLVPSMWRSVLAAGPENYKLAALELASMSGEAPRSTDINQVLERVCPRISFVYTASETFTGSAVMCDPVKMMAKGKTGFVGRPIPGAAMRVIDPEGGFSDDCATGVEGEVALSGPSLAIGYFRDPELTAKRFQNGWWRSGDVGVIDADGDLMLTGRCDNVINSGGIKIAAEEIEAALLLHEAVAQCAVVGQPDPAFGQRVEAYVVVATAMPEPTPETLAAWLRHDRQLPGFKVPKAFHFLNELPTGFTGKLYRRALLRPTSPSG